MEEQKMNVLHALQKIRVGLIDMDIKKSGHNDYSNYDYFELSDFLPSIQKLALENGVVCIYSISNEKATLDICDINDRDNCVSFSIPIAEVSMKGANAIQNVGCLTTYTRRYLYMIAFEIAENEEIEPVTNAPNNADAINNQLISDKDVKVIKAVADKKGIAEVVICKDYNIGSFADMTFDMWNNAMKRLDKSPDKVSA
jgi:hypothetical protein